MWYNGKMSMRDAIAEFNRQFAFNPVIQNGGGFHPASHKKFVVCGMGGSELSAELLQIFCPGVPVIKWRDYDLPPPDVTRDALIIASSYSGNTEETISAFHEARKRELPLAAIAVGGELLEQARRHAVPYIQLPDTGIQPRSDPEPYTQH